MTDIASGLFVFRVVACSDQLVPIHASDAYSISDFPTTTASVSSGVASEDFPVSITGDDYVVVDRSFTPLQSLSPDCVHDVHHVFHKCLSELEEVMLGYALPEPFFSDWLKAKLDELFACLRDPMMPLLELQVRHCICSFV